jgi:replicative DNA helicase
MNTPQAIDFEEAILGSLMLDKHCIDKCTDITPQMFFKDEHRIIFTNILKLLSVLINRLTSYQFLNHLKTTDNLNRLEAWLP